MGAPEPSMPEPVVRQARRGFLALSPPGAMFQIGASGDTPDEARLRFQEQYRMWEQVHGRGQGKARARASS